MSLSTPLASILIFPGQTQKKNEKPNVGLAIHNQKKLACEICYDLFNNLKIVKTNKKIENPIVGLSPHYKMKLAF